MSEIVPVASTDIATLHEDASIVEKLAASGAITEGERNHLLDQFGIDHQTDRDACVRRARFAPITNHPPITEQYFGEEFMNANDIVTQIEQARAVMSAQVRKLNEFSPTPLAMSAAPPGGSNNLADMLHATVFGHFANAADSLRAIAEVEAGHRAPVERTVGTERVKAPSNAQVIDSAFREVN